jgi:hypothetical protein
MSRLLGPAALFACLTAGWVGFTWVQFFLQQ